MNFSQYQQQLHEIFSGRNTLYHATDEAAARYIKDDKAFAISDAKDLDLYSDDGDDESVRAPYISFARSRGSSYSPRGVENFLVVYEFDKNVLRRNTKREKASFEPYDFWQIDTGDSRWRGGRGGVQHGTRRAHGSHETEDRLWFDSDAPESKGVFNSIDKVHIVLGSQHSIGAIDVDEFDETLSDIEIDGIDTLFYKSKRDWIQGKAIFDIFDAIEDVKRREAKPVERKSKSSGLFRIPKPGR
jgi:hypothetical protein